jgi:hypothetical protein
LTKPAPDAGPLDPALARIVAAWRALLEPIRRAMLTLAERQSP